MEKNDSMILAFLKLVNPLAYRDKNGSSLLFPDINEQEDFRPKVWPGLSSNCKLSHLKYKLWKHIGKAYPQDTMLPRELAFILLYSVWSLSKLKCSFPQVQRQDPSWFAQAAITEHHRLAGLNNTFIFSKFWKSEINASMVRFWQEPHSGFPTYAHMAFPWCMYT